MRFQAVLVAAAAMLCTNLAQADTIKMFNLSATLVDGSATGTVTLDQTTGKFTDSNLKVTASVGSGTFSGAPTSTSTGPTFSSYLFASTTPGFAFDLFLPTASLTSYAGGAICSTAVLCATNASNIQYLGVDIDNITSGTLTAVPVLATTPEPSSLILLGTGVLVLGALLRKRSAF